MQLLDDYLDLKKQLFDYFGYKEDWRKLAIDDARETFWYLLEDERGGGEVVFADTEDDLFNQGAGNYYVNEIYTQRHLPKWIYRAADYTMIVVDTHTDGNQLLQIFYNKQERKAP